MEKAIWELLVPTVSNEGKPFKTRFHKVWDTKVRELVGGLTIMQPNNSCKTVLYSKTNDNNSWFY